MTIVDVTRSGMDAASGGWGRTTDDAVQFDIELQLVNRSTRPLDLHEFNYSVRSGGDTVFSGRWSARAALAAGSVRTMTIPAVVQRTTLQDIADPSGEAGEAKLVLQGQLDYSEPGKIREVLRDLRLYRPSAKFAGPIPASNELIESRR